jgi:hypothetical protein
MQLVLAPLMALIAAAPAPAQPAEDAATAFASLKTLVGDWEGANERGTVKVRFHLVAADSVLVETWSMKNGRTSMTVYHLDKADLMTTHYCPMGNQPRLVLAEGPAGRLNFTFKDATNLRSPTEEHEHSFWIAFDGKNAFKRSETYLSAAESSTSEITFKRIGSAS